MIIFALVDVVNVFVWVVAVLMLALERVIVAALAVAVGRCCDTVVKIVVS